MRAGCDISRAVDSGQYYYAIRTDIKGYYASISRKILLEQLYQHFQDPRLRNYFEQIVNIAIDKNADIFNEATVQKSQKDHVSGVTKIKT